MPLCFNLNWSLSSDTTDVRPCEKLYTYLEITKVNVALWIYAKVTKTAKDVSVKENVMIAKHTYMA